MYPESSRLFIQDVQLEYQGLRLRGETREEAVRSLREIFAEPLEDPDDGPCIAVGIALALCKKKELTQDVKDAANAALKLLLSDDKSNKTWHKYKAHINDPDSMGPEALYRAPKRYSPDWEVGDVLIRKFTCPRAAEVGLQDWFAVFYKVGEYEDVLLWKNQLMYVLLCPPCREEEIIPNIGSLHYFPFMNHGKTADYLVGIEIRNRKSEQPYALKKIGNVVGFAPPANRAGEGLYTPYPLFANIRKDLPWPDYEETICNAYRLLRRSKGERWLQCFNCVQP